LFITTCIEKQCTRPLKNVSFIATWVIYDIYNKGPSIKDVRSHGGLSSEDKGSSSNADVSTFWRKKTSDFLKFMVC